MDVIEAAAILGLVPGSPIEVVRARFRHLVMAHHPDRGGSAEMTRVVVVAYDVLLRDLEASGIVPAPPSAAAQPEATPEAPSAPEDRLWRVDDGTLAIARPADEAFVLLVEAGHRIGSITYVDRHCGVLETLLRTTEGTTVSMLVTLQGRGTGHTEAFFSLEPIDAVRGPIPSVADVTELIGQLVLDAMG